MRIAIFANKRAKSQAVKKKLYQKFVERHFVIDDEEPDVVVTIGGDGTLLSAFHHYKDNHQKDDTLLFQNQAILCLYCTKIHYRKHNLN